MDKPEFDVCVGCFQEIKRMAHVISIYSQCTLGLHHIAGVPCLRRCTSDSLALLLRGLMLFMCGCNVNNDLCLFRLPLHVSRELSSLRRMCHEHKSAVYTLATYRSLLLRDKHFAYDRDSIKVWLSEGVSVTNPLHIYFFRMRPQRCVQSTKLICGMEPLS